LPLEGGAVSSGRAPTAWQSWHILTSIFFDAVVVFPKEAFIFAVQALLEDHFLVDEQSIEDLRDRWYSNAQVTGSDMRAWVKMNAEVVAPWPRERTF
jgi:hypothetical protein